tara:strand:- start:2227 stop:3315 length:1089 start_codon:yes stop_codon:yes gene_type:complete
MIGGIFGVLGQAQQQAEAQKQKNLESENEMNRMMMMSGYRPQADPSATQGGAPQQGIMEMLGQTYGKPDPYQFDPSQYAFDPNSPQGQELAIKSRSVGVDEKRVDEVERHNKATEDITKQGQLDEWHLGTLKNQLAEKSLTIKERNQTLHEQVAVWDRYFKDKGLDIDKLQIESGRYKVFENDGQTFVFDPYLAAQGKEAWTRSDPQADSSLPLKVAASLPAFIKTLKENDMFPDMSDEQLEKMGTSLMAVMMDGLHGSLNKEEQGIVGSWLDELDKKTGATTEGEPDIGGGEEEPSAEEGGYQNKWDGSIYKDGRPFPGLRDDIYHNFSPDAETQSFQDATGIRPYTPSPTTKDFRDMGGA